MTTDNLATALIQLGWEVWALRRRAFITERLMEEKGTVSREMIEQYVPSSEEMEEWDQDLDAFVRRIYDVLARQLEIPTNSLDITTEQATSEADETLIDEQVKKEFYWY